MSNASDSGRHLGVCSWSLQPKHPEQLIERVVATGRRSLQLALDPLRTGAWDTERTVAGLDAAGLAVRSGMMSTRGEDYSTLETIQRTGGLRPTAYWPENLAAAEANAALAARLGLSLVTFHAGFLPHDGRDPERATLLGRLSAVAERFAEQGVSVGLETGQETAETLVAVLEELDRPTVGVNFDPANMLLYDMGDPVAALRALAPWVRQIHVKDARRTTTPGTWGEEVTVGTGEVDWPAFFDVVRAAGLGCDLMLEREAGDDRVGDVRRGAELVAGLIEVDAPEGVGS